MKNFSLKKLLILLLLFLYQNSFSQEHPLKSIESDLDKPKQTTEDLPKTRDEIDPEFRFAPINFRSNEKSFSFGVANVKKIEDQIEYLDSKKFLRKKFGKIISHSSNLKKFRANDFRANLQYKTNLTHPFLLAGELAYRIHKPMVISPDHIWLLILQGVMIHLKQSPKKYKKTINFNSKKTLEYKFYSKRNMPWSEIFENFSIKINKKINPEFNKILNLRFSSITKIDEEVKILSKMNLFEEYFEYKTVAICGIPYFRILGKTEDWEKIQDAIKYFKKLNLNWWVKHLEPIIEEFVNASKGNVNQKFWDNFITNRSKYGVQYLDGWINVLFPFKILYSFTDEEGQTKRVLGYIKNKFEKSHQFNDFPLGISETKILYQDDSGKIKKFIITSGFIGITETDEGEVTAVTGWLIRPNKNIQIIESEE
ncbi:MAG: DUF4419 domain-containing protein [Leptospiraceae bacterium]|nr:DUF4419 domain-containing protein [Leptospiraceae bacterium]